MEKNILDKVKEIKLDAGMYADAEAKGTSFDRYLENLLAEKGIPTAFHGKSNTFRKKAKETARRNGKEVPAAAFDLFCKAYGVTAFGDYSDTVEKMLQTPNLNVLFPEFIANRLWTGSVAASLIPYFCPQTVTVDGFKFESLSLTTSDKTRKTRKIGHGTDIPVVKIQVGTESIWIPKFAIGVEMTYEQMRYQRLDYLGNHLRMIGLQLGVDKTDEFFYTLQNGDGNSNGLQAGNIVDVDTTNVVAKADLLEFWRELPTPYVMDVFAGSKANMLKVDDVVTSLTNPSAQLGAIMTEQRRTIPTGYEWDSGIITSDYLVGIDKANCGVYITNDAVLMQEQEKIIRNQTVLTTATTYGCFRINDKNTIAALHITL